MCVKVQNSSQRFFISIKFVLKIKAMRRMHENRYAAVAAASNMLQLLSFIEKVSNLYETTPYRVLTSSQFLHNRSLRQIFENLEI